MKNVSSISDTIPELHAEKKSKKKSGSKKEKKSERGSKAQVIHQKEQKRGKKKEEKTSEKNRGQEIRKERKKKETSSCSKQHLAVSTAILPLSRKVEKRLKRLEGLGEKILKKLKICINNKRCIQEKRRKEKKKKTKKTSLSHGEKKEEENQEEPPAMNPFVAHAWEAPISASSPFAVGGGGVGEEANFYFENFLTY